MTHPEPVELIAIGASAGGITALQAVLKPLPAGFRLPIVIVLHIPEDRPSHLPETLERWLPIPISEPEDKEPILPARAYVAPPAYHCLIEKDRRFSLIVDDPVHFSIPSIDVLFESVAEAFGKNALGVILTGASDDGAEGLRRIVEAGGRGIVQNPTTAQCPEMPRAAIKHARGAIVLSLAEIGAFLARLS